MKKNILYKGCGKERPLRKTLCQLKKGHKGSCQALVYWEDEELWEKMKRENK